MLLTNGADSIVEGQSLPRKRNTVKRDPDAKPSRETATGNRMKMRTIPSATLVLCIALLCAACSKSGMGAHHDFFATEDDYVQYVEQNVRFDGLELAIVDIQRGENFWKIAKRHNVNIDTLLGANPYWESLVASLDQRIIVPSRKGVLHFVNSRSEIRDVAKAYQADESSVLVQRLPVMDGILRRFTSRSPIAVFVLNARPRAINMTEALASQFNLREMFRSPLGGRYSSFFGGRIHPIFREHRFHNGLDIAARHGTPVGAAAGGVVTSTGWMGGYGNTVIISHPKGFCTLYGHLSRISVRAGQQVGAGRLIGRVGSTGWSTGPHLHFTMWHNGKLVNPMKVLW